MLRALAILCLLTACNFLPDEPIYMPPNNLDQEQAPEPLEPRDMNEELFNLILDEIEEHYAPIIEFFGGRLNIQRLWEDPTVNASAGQFDDVWIINMYGGLARRPEISPDGFTVVACHEIGHHLAGYPFVDIWAANEGSSDYFAILACTRKLWAGSAETLNIDTSTLASTAKKLCDQTWRGDDRKLCYRSMLAAKSVADLMATAEGIEVSFDTPDQNIVTLTEHSHPDAQCRLDTMMSASLCDAVWDDTLIPGINERRRNTIEAEEEANTVSCFREFTGSQSAMQDISRGFRPRCWYAPLLD